MLELISLGLCMWALIIALLLILLPTSRAHDPSLED